MIDFPNYANTILDKIQEQKNKAKNDEKKLHYQTLRNKLLKIPEVALLDAANKNNGMAVSLLLQVRSINSIIQIQILKEAIQRDFIPVVKSILKYCHKSINVESKRKIISLACEYGNIEIWNILLQNKSILSALTETLSIDGNNIIKKIQEKKQSTLIEEEKLRYQKIIHRLLQVPEIALLEALEKNNENHAKSILLKKHNIDDRIKEKILIESTQKGFDSIVKILLESYVFIHMLDNDLKRDILEKSIKYAQVRVLQVILEKQSFVEILMGNLRTNGSKILKKTQEEKESAINEFDKFRYQEVINIILKIPEAAFLDAVNRECKVEIESLLLQHSIDERVKERALIEAAKKGFSFSVQVLLNQYKDTLNIRCFPTVLFSACTKGHLDLLNILLEHHIAHEIANSAFVFLYRETQIQVDDLGNNAEFRERCQDILSRLLEIDPSLAEQENTLSYVANNSESSMTKVTKAERSLINHLKEHYKSVYESKSWNEIHAEILSYLEHEYHQSPAIDGYHWVWMLPDNSKLPIDFVPADTIGLHPQGEKTTLYWRDIKGDLQQKEVNTVDVLACYKGKENWLYQNTQDVTLLKTVLETLGVPIHPYQDIKCPLEYDKDYSHPSASVAYYRHPMHNAWRYFSKHNPWMDDKAPFTHTSENGNRCAIISDSAKELISCLWIALNGNVPLEPGFPKEGNLRLFAGVISENNRGHNGDEKPFYSEDLDAYNNIVNQHQGNDELIRQLLLELRITLTTADDLKADKPTCVWGIIKRLLQIFYGHPYINAPEAQSLDLHIILQRMEDHLIKPKEKTAEFDNFSDKVNALGNEEILTYIFQRISDICALEAFDEDDRIMLRENNFDKYQSIIDIPVKQLHAFLEQTKRWFGKERIEEKHDKGLKLDAGSGNAFLNQLHDSYEEFIKYCANNVLEAFAETIYDVVDKRLHDLRKRFSHNSPILYHYRNRLSHCVQHTEIAQSENVLEENLFKLSLRK